MNRLRIDGGMLVSVEEITCQIHLAQSTLTLGINTHLDE